MGPSFHLATLRPTEASGMERPHSITLQPPPGLPMRSTLLLSALFLLPATTLSAQDAQLNLKELLDGPQQMIGVGISCQNCILDNPYYEFHFPIEITSVTEGSVAGKAGVIAGDTVLKVGGSDITSEQGWGMFALRTPGSTIEWVVKREGKPVTLKLTFPKADDRP